MDQLGGFTESLCPFSYKRGAKVKDLSDRPSLPTCPRYSASHSHEWLRTCIASTYGQSSIGPPCLPILDPLLTHSQSMVPTQSRDVNNSWRLFQFRLFNWRMIAIPSCFTWDGLGHVWPRVTRVMWPVSCCLYFIAGVAGYTNTNTKQIWVKVKGLSVSSDCLESTWNR